MHLFIDPILLAVPTFNADAAADAQQHEAFADHLQKWDEEWCRKRHDFFTSAECIDALFQDKCFPDSATLRQHWDRAELSGQLSPEAATAIATRLAINTPHLEDFFAGIDLRTIDVDNAEGAFNINPDLLRRLPVSVAAALQCALGRIAWLRSTPRRVNSDEQADPNKLLLVTHPFDDESTVSIRADVLADDLLTVDNELPLVSHPDHLLRFSSLMELWDKPHDAIRLMASEIGQLPIGRCIFGPGFVASLRSCDLDNPAALGRLKTIYRTCVQLLPPEPLPLTKKHHPLSTSNDKPIRHGRWSAYRIWISGDGAAFRLHYWRSGSDVIFMQVNPHRDMSIGDPPIE